MLKSVTATVYRYGCLDCCSDGSTLFIVLFLSCFIFVIASWNRCKNSNIFSIIGSNHKKTDIFHSFLSRFASTIRNSYSFFSVFTFIPNLPDARSLSSILYRVSAFLFAGIGGDVLMCDVVFGCKSTKSLRNLFACKDTLKKWIDCVILQKNLF